MATSSLIVPSPPLYPSPSSLTSISNISSNISAASFYFPFGSTVSCFTPATSSLSSSFPGILASSSLRLCLALTSLLFPKAWVVPSMPAKKPAHSYSFPHDVLASSPAALITSLKRDRLSVSPIPTGRTPGILSRATRLHTISVK